ncbi:hypothetical protein MTR67_007148 [Solanum verrucosum]|uniref:Uncharacterized protein n=1 Tax=Solanum verrucosum TaxID=315347 RepID=A0AAF0TES3_SOLVR|nr:hypothetical protein MTR67_007148 [Solanum verrucosum]
MIVSDYQVHSQRKNNMYYLKASEVFEKLPSRGTLPIAFENGFKIHSTYHAYFRTHEVFEKIPPRGSVRKKFPLEAHCQRLLEMASKFTQKVLSQGYFSLAFSSKSNFGLQKCDRDLGGQLF